jgi:hypothetical protein
MRFMQRNIAPPRSEDFMSGKELRKKRKTSPRACAAAAAAR